MADAREQALAETYDLLMFDLDGVVYVDGRVVAGAPEGIAWSRRAGAQVAFITNNASRTPVQVAAHLRELGIEAAPADVVTSSQAAARLLRSRVGAGAAIAVLGTDGLLEALREQELEPVDVDVESAVAIVSGYAPEVRWKVIMQAAVRIRNGLPWWATNTDPTLPTGDGPAPGHGTLVRMISEFADVDPVVAGKPEKPLFDETLRRVGGARPLMVGDSLHTDIAGAHRAGIDSLLVLTGVTDLAELARARPDQRPTWIGHDLGVLGRPGVRAGQHDESWTAEGWTARVVDGRLVVEGSGSGDAWWACVGPALWSGLDAAGEPADISGVVAPAPDDRRG
ncbi:HAD-IIA family hydrolase [Nocardioides cynanchi]|uniref:HAD-IIA family hydrolase n=1 Tax=Nocardioides cynanchi TaxID=2558918 RepID=UPI001EE177C1|nr:HAD-IIA family hydrolase [Nocardioides cynanchi]